MEKSEGDGAVGGGVGGRCGWILGKGTRHRGHRGTRRKSKSPGSVGAKMTRQGWGTPAWNRQETGDPGAYLRIGEAMDQELVAVWVGARRGVFCSADPFRDKDFRHPRKGGEKVGPPQFEGGSSIGTEWILPG